MDRCNKNKCLVTTAVVKLAHKTHRSIVAAHVVKKRSWAPKVSKKMHGLFINSMGFFNFLMGRTGPGGVFSWALLVFSGYPDVI
jgi:hypothetical protein